MTNKYVRFSSLGNVQCINQFRFFDPIAIMDPTLCTIMYNFVYIKVKIHMYCAGDGDIRVEYEVSV